MKHTLLATSVVCLSAAVLAQTPNTNDLPYEAYVAPVSIDWKQANQTVRDVGGWRAYLKQVQDGLKKDAASATPSTMDSYTLNHAIDRALQLKNLSIYDVQLNDLHAIEAVLSTQQLWLDAVGSKQALAAQQIVQDNAYAAAELHKRIVQVGNAPAVNHAKAHLAYLNAVQATVSMRHAAAQSAAALSRALRQPALALPASLPTLPKQAREVSQLTPREQARLHIVDTGSAYQAAYQLASLANGDALLLTKTILEDAVLRYNGMIVGTFELLAAQRDDAQAQLNAVQALTQFWLADAAFQATVRGVPTAIALSTNGAGTQTKAAQH